MRLFVISEDPFFAVVAETADLEQGMALSRGGSFYALRCIRAAGGSFHHRA